MNSEWNRPMMNECFCIGLLLKSLMNDVISVDVAVAAGIATIATTTTAAITLLNYYIRLMK